MIKCRNIMLILLMIVFLVPQTVEASTAIEVEKEVSLTIDYNHQGKKLSGVKFSLYRIAEVTEDAQLDVREKFKRYVNQIEDDLTQEEWAELAVKLSEHFLVDSVVPTDTGVTDKNGLLTFPNQASKLTTGLYLVIGERLEEGNVSYTPQPFLICLPNRTEADTWDYAPKAEPKPDVEEKKTEIHVKKVWEDEGHEDERPEKITVGLYDGDELYATVDLNKGNNWNYTWADLDASFNWNVREETKLSDYEVDVEQNDTIFIVTNTYTEDTPPDEKLPQTGTLWWPVPILAGCGMLLFIIGWIRRQKNGD